MNKITQYLNRYIAGDVFDGLAIRESYATDGSFLRMVPRFVALPKSAQDVSKLMRFSNSLAERDFDLPITVRGGGHDKTGGAIGAGLLVSTEKMNKIQEIDVRNRLVRVQAGVKLGELNNALKLHGLTIPIVGCDDLSIGGLVGNSLKMMEFVEKAEIVLSNGERIQTGSMNNGGVRRRGKGTSFEGKIYRNLEKLLLENKELVGMMSERTFDAEGYFGVFKIKKGGAFDLLPLFVASQGTLGVVTELILHCEVLKTDKQRVFLAFNDFRKIVGCLEMLRGLGPSRMDFYDMRILCGAADFGKGLVKFKKQLNKKYAILVEFNGKKGKNCRNIKKCLRCLSQGVFVAVEDEGNTDDFQRIAGFLLGYVNNAKSERIAIADDVMIPDEYLVGLMNVLDEMGEESKKKLVLFGSILEKSYSVRPEVNMESADDRKFVLKFLKEYAGLIKECGGELNYRASEGRTKAVMSLKRQSSLGDIYREVKHIFDPNNILNPGVKNDVKVGAMVRNMRTSRKSGIIYS